jgi:photosystem II stability/assembly factor-like uncharacterized protein
MKKNYASFSVMMLLLMPVLMHAQLGSGKWSFSNPKPFGFWSSAISYADDNNALIVGDAGGIAKTTDGGGTWQYFCYTVNVDGAIVKPVFNDVQFVSNTLAYAAGNNGVLIKSVDGGVNWTNLNNPFLASRMEINTVFFTDALTGYIGGDGDAITRKSTLYKTTDGGASWQAAYEFPAPVIDWLSSALYKVRFNSTGVGYVTGANGLVFKYANGVWKDYSITDTIHYPNVRAIDTVYYDNYNGGFDTVLTTYSDNIANLSQQNYRGIAIVSDSVVLVSAQNNGGLIRINTSADTGSYYMANNGNAWAQVYAPIGAPQMYNLVCRDGNQVLGCASYGDLLVSNDKGYTWVNKPVYPIGSTEANFGFFGIDVSPANRVGLCGASGVIADSATQWRRPYHNYKQGATGGFFGGFGINSMSFADANNGIAVGGGGGILRTSNAGDTWEDISSGGFSPWDYYTDVTYAANGTIFTAANNGQFFKSSDNGSTFDLLFNEPNNGNLAAMHFTSPDSGWMVSNNNYFDTVTYELSFHPIIYRTSDGGFTWDSSSTVFPSVTNYSDIVYFNDIQFLNGTIGYAIAGRGLVYKTTDGGLNWVAKPNVPAAAAAVNLKSISIVDENILFVSGEEGIVMKSDDGGDNWVLTNTGLPGGFSRYEKILMLNASQGVVFGNGNAYSTIDGGASWSAYYAPVNDAFVAASYAPISGCTTGICNKIFAGGLFRGVIMKFDSDVVLPVKFSNLTGAATRQGNQLLWTAFSQETVSWFEVERSADGSRFSTIGTKIYPGSFQLQQYQWLDAQTTGGRFYYRIKAVEKTGAVFYTNIVSISSTSIAKWNALVSYGNLIVRNAAIEKGPVQVDVFNQAGQTVATAKWQHTGGVFNQFMPLPATIKGVYMVRITHANSVYSSQLFIQ